MADFLAEKRAEIDNRLKELRPLHDEFLRLERAKAALDGLDGPRRGPGRPRGSSSSAGTSGGTKRRRRRRSGGTRGDEALQLVRQNPGATVSELARMMNISPPNYLYRVMATLQSDGSVKKQGKGYVAT
jgi:winged helix-turn-helix DNA-binding protein